MKEEITKKKEITERNKEGRKGAGGKGSGEDSD
jgi:hypothetical protein